jgi:hypothetical protein
MPYVIAFVIMIVAAGALLLFRHPVEAPNTPATEESAEAPMEQVSGFPEGFTPPTESPPSMNPTEEAPLEMETVVETEEAAAAPMETEAVVEPEEETVPEVSTETTTDRQTFVVEASYFTPRRTEHDMVVTLELEGETIVAVNILYDGGPAMTPMHSAFDGAYTTEVIGANINEIDLSRVGGASLTSVAFNDAVADVRAQL